MQPELLDNLCTETPKAGVPVIPLLLDHAAVLGGAEWSLYDIARHYKSPVLLFEDGPLRDMLRQAHIPCDVVPAPAILRRRGSAIRVGRRLVLSVQLRYLARQISRRTDGVDLLYANSHQSFLAASEAARYTGLPVVWHLREMLSAGYIDAASRRLSVRYSRRPAAHIIANSRATARDFVAAGGASKRLRVIHNGVEVRAGAHLPGKTGWEGTQVVGMFARLARWKGHKVLLDALALMPTVHAVVAGTPLFESKAYAAELQQYAADLGVSERVHFVGHLQEVHSLMREVDIVVHASTAPEPFGRVIVEAMHLAKPVVASETGGVSEIITHGETGVLVPPGNVARLANAIVALLNDEEERVRLGKRAAAEAASRFTLPAMFARLDACLANIVA